MAIITLNNNSLSSVTALPAAIPIGVDGISSSATSTLLTLSSNNRLGIDQSTDIDQIISASGLNGQTTEDWLRIGQTWMCGGVWSGSASTKVEFTLNANTSFFIEIVEHGYGSGIDYAYGTYRSGAGFDNTYRSNGGGGVTYTQPNGVDTFTTNGSTHGTYHVRLTGNLSSSPLVTIV